MRKIDAGIPLAQVMRPTDLAGYQEGAVVSRTIIDKKNREL